MPCHRNIKKVDLYDGLQFILLILIQNTEERGFILSHQRDFFYTVGICTTRELCCTLYFRLLTFHILTVKFSNKQKQNYKTLETTKLCLFLFSHFLANRNKKLEQLLR